VAARQAHRTAPGRIVGARNAVHAINRRPPPRPTLPARRHHPPPPGHRRPPALGPRHEPGPGPVPGPHRQRPRVMATFRNLAITILRLPGHTSTAAGTRPAGRTGHDKRSRTAKRLCRGPGDVAQALAVVKTRHGCGLQASLAEDLRPCRDPDRGSINRLVPDLSPARFTSFSVHQ
jgi:hypothetical protein